MYRSVFSLLLASSLIGLRLDAAAPALRADTAPPPGLLISETDRAELEKSAAQLGREIEALRAQTRGTAEERLLPDVMIYHKAVDWALRYDELMARGRDALPSKIHFTTWTLSYNRAAWFTVDGLERHWQRARVDGELNGDKSVHLKTSGATALTLGPLPESAASADSIRINGQEVSAHPKRSRGSCTASFEQQPDGKWSSRAGNEDSSLRKRPGLQGPIDDAFTGRFLMVRPTGKPLSEALGKWAANELAYAMNQWRAQFRRDAMVKDDTAVTEADLAAAHLILWGDPQSNQLLKRILSKLPLKWDGGSISIGASSGAADQLAPVMIFPNPLNPKRYVVLNSGFTFAEFGPASNAQQTPKLPDFALVDVSVPRERRLKQGVVAAGFFDERWAHASGAGAR